MKKRVLLWIITFAITLSLFGCGGSSSAEDTTIITKSDPNFDTSSVTETKPQPKYSNLNLTLDEVIDVLEDSTVVEEFVTYETPDFTVYRTGYGEDGAILFSSPGSDKIEVAYFLAYSKASRGSNDTKAAVAAQELLCEYCDSNNIRYRAEEIEQEPYLIFSVSALDSTLENLPLSIREFRSENEFFASETRVKTFCDLMNYCKYQDLRDFVGEFIAAGQCPDNDISYHLTTKLDELIPMLQSCHVKVDNVEKNAEISYGNITEITKKVNVLPIVKTSTYGAILDITAGFKRNGWLFFDTVYFASASTETEKFMYSHPVTDVLQGGIIYECVDISGRAHTALLEICNNENPVIRFENSDSEEYIDHELTEDEIKALTQLQAIRDLHDEIWDSLRKWEDA